ncbi:hypothetical protein PCANC_01490 [Puccinia coronata f. sp. avenae]|uniref:Uncharacterized protein n=1 Tax=Puccinia coronata f. sp. avenae TaxID=200324 RepID=A0A2N5W2X9_9BASI|nr:hypothetical protein PCANC_13059 [Puccinia coronata f. sp. avenae]PLW56603.1 hypothetical protein PCANC_01490 [Puccinia coronata f. sp. avenae]
MCEVAAPDDVWGQYVAVHANAKKYWGVPFPEFQQLDKIFGTSLATGEAAQSLSQRLLVQPQTQDPDTSGEGNGVSRENPPGQPTPSPTAYLLRSRSASQKASVVSALNNLVDYLKNKNELAIQQTQQKTVVQKAVNMYQENHLNKVYDALKVLQNKSNAQVFTTIRDKGIQLGWLTCKIDDMKGH